MPDVVRIEPADILPKKWAMVLDCPAPPGHTPSADSNAAKLILENYKVLREAAMDDTLKILDAFVVKLLLPLFTSFVGYVFGSQARGTER